ncbi:MAG: phosphatase PAP2 family protein [Alphaproteobacteria bacterium]|nr:phosphatase PAP2 family protein [Alphaproteobacteria bacterium]
MTHQHLPKVLRTVAAGAAFAALVVLTVLYVDLPVSLYFRNLDQSHHALIDAFRAFTDFGKSKWYLWPAGVVLIVAACLCRARIVQPTENLSRNTCWLLQFFLYIAASGIITDILKPLIGQARPVEWLRDGVYGFHPFSFTAAWNAMPSGHATTAFSLILILSARWPRLAVLWTVGGFVLALSRVLVNAHYVSDIFMAAAVAWACFIILRQGVVQNGIKTLHDSIFPIDEPGGPSA